MNSIRILLIIAVTHDWDLLQLDVKSAFLHGDIEEDIYVMQPKGFVDQNISKHVCILHKALYGLKQSPRQWFSKIHDELTAMGVQQLTKEQCLYQLIQDNQQAIIRMYVDDLILTGSCSILLTKVKNKLMNKFEMSDQGDLQFILGVSIGRDRTKNLIYMGQQHYAQKISLVFKVTQCKFKQFPLMVDLASLYNAMDKTETDKHLPYRQEAGCLMYLMSCTRPDLAFPVSLLSKFNNCYTELHWNALKQVLKFVHSTSQFELPLGGKKGLIVEGWSDSDWAGHPDNRKSLTGTCVKLNEGLITWNSQK